VKYGNGQLMQTGSFKDEKKVGVWKRYHPNGALYDEGQFLNDKKAGQWRTYDAKGKRDPFVPLLTQKGERLRPPGLDEEDSPYGEALSVPVALQGIVFDSAAESFAVINGEIVRQNESLGPIQVLKIEPGQVTVRVGNDERVLFVTPPEQQREELSVSP
jgi:hypothetical protein